jgi:hypothetical protein
MRKHNFVESKLQIFEQNLFEKQTMQLKLVEKRCESEADVFGEQQKRRHRIFGCWHMRMSEPRTIGKTTFAYCKNCGSRRSYDLTTRKHHGSFYHPPLYVNGV